MRGIKTEKTEFEYRGPIAGIGDLPCWREVELIGDVKTTVIYSVWEPSDEERKAIAEGQNIELGIVGEPIPPVSLTVTDQKKVENG